MIHFFAEENAMQVPVRNKSFQEPDCTLNTSSY